MKIPADMSAFRLALNKNVDDLRESFEVDIVFKTMRYEGDGTKFSCTMEVTNKAINGKDVEQVLFDKQCALFGFTPEDYKKEFKLKNYTFYLHGFNLKAPKNNCKIRKVNSEAQFVANDRAVKRAMEKAIKQ